MCHEQSQSGGASITFFSSVYQINISYTLRFVDVEFFIPIPCMHSKNYCVWYPNNPRKCKSRHFSECVIWHDWHEIPPQHSLLHLMQTGLVSALPVQMELVCRVNSGNGHLSLSGGHCQQTTCSPHLTVYEMYQLSWQPRWTQVWFYLLDMKPGSGPIVTTIMEILLRVKPL